MVTARMQPEPVHLAALAFADFQRDLRRERRLAASMERKRRREIMRFLGDAAESLRLIEAL